MEINHYLIMIAFPLPTDLNLLIEVWWTRSYA